MVKLIFELIFLVNREASFVESRTNSKDLSLKPNRPLNEIFYSYFYQKFDSLDGCGNVDLSKIRVLEKKPSIIDIFREVRLMKIHVLIVIKYSRNPRVLK